MPKKEETKAFKTFYPSLPGKETRLTVAGRALTIRPDGYTAESEDEEKELIACSADPRWHVTETNPMIPHHEEQIAFHKGEIEKHEKAMNA